MARPVFRGLGGGNTSRLLGTSVRVDGRWCYGYRAIDADGYLVDSMLGATRDMGAAKRFFARACTVVGHVPERVTTDGHDAYPPGHPRDAGPTGAASDQPAHE
jgi:transposase-like protein